MKAFTAVVLGCLVVLAAHLWGYAQAGSAYWGTHQFAMFPAVWILGGTAVSLLLFFLVWGRVWPPRLRFPFPLAVTAAVILGGLAFWFLRERLHLLGNSEVRIESLLQGRFIWQLEPGGILVPFGLYRITGLEPATLFAVLSVACGVAYLVLAAVFAREVGEDRWGRGIIFFLLALAGLTRLFYGFVETTPLLAALVTLYLVLGARLARGKGSAAAVAVAGTLALAVHPLALLLLPSLIYILLRGGEGGRTRRAPWLLVPIVALVALGVMMASRGLGPGEVLRVTLGNLLPLHGAPTLSEPYNLLSWHHLRDILQLEMLVGPFAAGLVALLLVTGGGRRLGPDGAFLLVGGVPWWIFSLVSYPGLGFPRQWGLFVPAFIALIMVAGLLLARIPGRQERATTARAAAGALVALSLFHLIPWVGMSLNRDRESARLAGLYGPQSAQSGQARSSTFDQLGTYFLSRGEVDNAELAYREAVNADTTNGYAAGHLGSILLAGDKPAQAARLLEWATKQDPDREYLYYELAGAYRQLGRQGPAAAAYRRALALNPNFRQAYINLSVIERQAGRLDTTEALLKTALGRFPGDPQILGNLARLQQERGDTAGAVAMYREVLEKNPDDVNVAYNLGGLLLQQSKPKEAIPYLEMVTRRKPRDAEAWINLGVARNLDGETDAAAHAFQQALVADPTRPEAYFNLFRIHLERGDSTEALGLLKVYAARDSTSRWGKLARGLLSGLGAAGRH